MLAQEPRAFVHDVPRYKKYAACRRRACASGGRCPMHYILSDAVPQRLATGAGECELDKTCGAVRMLSRKRW